MKKLMNSIKDFKNMIQKKEGRRRDKKWSKRTSGCPSAANGGRTKCPTHCQEVNTVGQLLEDT